MSPSAKPPSSKRRSASSLKRGRRSGSEQQQSVRIVSQLEALQKAGVRAYARIDGPNSGGKLIGYARVSTDDQELRMQLDALEKAGCWNIYKEKRSASKGKRPELELALMDLRPGDTLVVWRLDRLVRNARMLYTLLDRIHAAVANFKSLQEQFDFTTPMGQFVLGILGLVAQLEAQMTAHRTSAGIAALQAAGGSYGAKPKLSEKRAALLVKLRKSNPKKWTKAALALRFRISPASVTNYVNRARRRRPNRK